MFGSAPHESVLLQRGSRGKGKGPPFPCTPIPADPPPLCSGQFRLTIPNTYSTITRPASLRSDCCSPSLRNAVRLPSGIDVHLHRNTHPDGRLSVNARSSWRPLVWRSSLLRCGGVFISCVNLWRYFHLMGYPILTLWGYGQSKSLFLQPRHSHVMRKPTKTTNSPSVGLSGERGVASVIPRNGGDEDLLPLCWHDRGHSRTRSTQT